MTPLALGGVWLAVAGAGLAAQLPALRRWVLILPLLAAAAALAAASQASWPGPTAGDGGLALGRVGQGLLAATALATFATLVAGGEVTRQALPSLGFVGAGSVLMLSATTPVVWSVGAVLAVAAMVARWVTAFPSRATLSAGRVAGTGAALLLCAAPLLASTDALLEPRLRLSGALLLFGIGSLLALLPVGGWAPRSLAEVHGADAASWVLIVCPSLLLTTGVTIDHLPPDARYPLDHGLLVAGIATAVWSSLAAVTAVPRARYGRVFIADVGLCAAALGAGQPGARSAVLLIVLTHLGGAPLLLQPAAARLRPFRRAAWLAMTTLPPSPSFWGRLLALEALASSALPLGLGVLCLGALTFAALAGWHAGDHAPRRAARQSPPESGSWGRGTVAFALCGFLALVAVHPHGVTSWVFGSS